ncbi:hypothetical protein EBS57_09730 [bacterium]|nr:hypothetical protein [bacterium]
MRLRHGGGNLFQLVADGGGLGLGEAHAILQDVLARGPLRLFFGDQLLRFNPFGQRVASMMGAVSLVTFMGAAGAGVGTFEVAGEFVCAGTLEAD